MSQPKNSRLQFTDAERGDPRLKEHIRRADKVADKADAAQAKVPKKKKLVKYQQADPATGKSKPHLRFEDVDKPAPVSKLAHTVKAAPLTAASAQAHRKIQEAEQENVGVESAHLVAASSVSLASPQAGKLIHSAAAPPPTKPQDGFAGTLSGTAEGGVRLAAHSRRAQKLKPYREAEKARMRLGKANVNALYQKHLRDNPQLASNPISRWRQKQAIRKQYAASVRSGEGVAATMENAMKAAKQAAERSRASGNFVWKHKNGFAAAIALFLAVSVFLNGLSSCTALVEGVLSGLGGSTYPSADGDMLGAEATYAGMEAALKNELDNYATLHPGHDEYQFDLDEIGHDPYVLISLLTAYHRGAWTLEQVRPTLEMLFDRQYILTETVTRQTRYDENSQPYEYTICKVKLVNSDLSHLPVYVLDEDGMHLYASYMSTLGNRPDLFPITEYPNASQRENYLDYDVPPEALEDEVFAAMLKEAEKYLGFPYVWGGTNPSTSFDCSGYVSWVINHSGWNYGRLGVMGLEDVCIPVSRANAKPGDLVFFIGTYDAPYPDRPSHVGIYVGNGMMIHCGSPISYANINIPYWQNHFYGFGRLREP